MLVQIDVEKELETCVKTIGGTSLDDSHGSNDLEKADYWFPEFNVIGELKCLSKDDSTEPKFKEWLNRRYEDWVRRGLAEPVTESAVVNLARLPRVCIDEVTSFLRKRVDRNLNKANSQIKSSKSQLHVPSALGLLILVNDTNRDLSPGMILEIAARSLPHKCKCVNSIIYFTANLPGRIIGIDQEALVWGDLNAKKVRPAVPRDLIN